MFINKPQTLLELKENIGREITTIINMLQRFMDSICE